METVEGSVETGWVTEVGGWCQDGHTCVHGSRCTSGCLNESNLPLFAHMLSGSLFLSLSVSLSCFD